MADRRDRPGGPVPTVSQERDERVVAEATDGVHLSLDVTARFHIVAAEVVQLDTELGPQYYAVLVAPTVQAQTRRAVGRLTLDALEAGREAAQEQIREGVEHMMRGRHVVIESVLIRQVHLSEPY